MTQPTSQDYTARYPVWDRAVRTFHWYLPIAIGVMWWSGEEGRMDIHEKVGYSLLCLVATRVIWGFVGSEAARFRAFLFAPRTVLTYLKAGGQYAGHNPLGGLSVTVLLLLLLVQAGSGVFSRDDLLFEGPFSYWAGDLSGTLTEWHKTNWLLLQGLIALHLLAVAWYQWRKKQPIVQAMWRGHAGDKFATSPPKPLWWAVLIAVLLSLALWGLVTIAPEAPSYY